VPIEALAGWLSRAPAQLAGLETVKGSLKPGHDADLVIWDPEATAVVDAAQLYHRHPITPYDGLQLRGVVRTTILRGEVVFDAGECLPIPRGRVIVRPPLVS
jgi:allantoinase